MSSNMSSNSDMSSNMSSNSDMSSNMGSNSDMSSSLHMYLSALSSDVDVDMHVSHHHIHVSHHHTHMYLSALSSNVDVDITNYSSVYLSIFASYV